MQDKNESQITGYKTVGLHIVFPYPLCFTPPLSCLLYPLILLLLKPQPSSVPLATLLLGEEPYHIVGSNFPCLPAQREPDTALLSSGPPRCSACERMAAFQNSFDSQSVTDVVLFEIYEDNMVSRRPEEQGAVKAVLDDRRFFFSASMLK